ncbi:MAG: acyl-CoA thioesterase [Gemmatimonadales bacterium]|nr:acyl-CoA thioesterase [Gemmatimonadales bacterium]NIN11697.1 acyl-CoA thioesterase [Gemmatimonadales bacterium]NIN50303.1 acyl-CoA thioesterase [Gemmatimonadales bacterium]NIP07767.1 acyl-CoA thioesterase [Gemmatimonadales bacterium]NIQ99170.1 acyl-CoA thioesterase [Gemmatimonadales bacterium]
MHGDVEPHPLLADYTVVVTIPVQWGELDAYGHVNNTVIFRYFESARVAYLDRCGFLESYDRDRVGAILHSTDCRFRRPVGYPDTVQVGGRSASVDSDRFTMEYLVVSLTEGEVVAEGTGVVVSFDYNRRQKTALPERVRRWIAATERH